MSKKILKKVPQWDTKLFNFLREIEQKTFKWGTWDCCIFALQSIEVMTDKKTVAVTWKDKMSALRYIKKEGGSLKAIADKFVKQYGLETIQKSFITCGDIVLINEQETQEDLLGVCSGNLILCVAEGGVTYKPNEDAKKVWRISS